MEETKSSFKNGKQKTVPASIAAGNPKDMSELLLIISVLHPNRRQGRKRDTKLTNTPFISHQPDYHAERHDSVFSYESPLWPSGRIILATNQYDLNQREVKACNKPLNKGWIPHHRLQTDPPLPFLSLLAIYSTPKPPAYMCHFTKQCVQPQHRWERCDLSVARSKRRLQKGVTDLCSPESVYSKWLYATVNASQIIFILNRQICSGAVRTCTSQMAQVQIKRDRMLHGDIWATTAPCSWKGYFAVSCHLGVSFKSNY